ncbi:hypothetical protein AAVH_38954 [Aphelenchoides avenae]|nr:hypothetical protein AAVH_38954 [Aphelenchus avenae]
MIRVSTALLVFTALLCGCSAQVQPYGGIGPHPGIPGFNGAEPGFPGVFQGYRQSGGFQVDSARPRFGNKLKRQAHALLPLPPNSVHTHSFKRSMDEVHQDHLPIPGQHPRVARDDETNGRLHEPHPYQTPRRTRQVEPRPDLPDLPRAARDVYDGRSRHPDGHPQPGRTWPQPPSRVARQSQIPPQVR